MLLRSSLFLRPSTLYIPIKRTLFSPEYLGMPKFLEARNNYRYSLSDEEKTLQKPKSIILSNDVRHTFYMAMDKQGCELAAKTLYDYVELCGASGRTNNMTSIKMNRRLASDFLLMCHNLSTLEPAVALFENPDFLQALLAAADNQKPILLSELYLKYMQLLYNHNEHKKVIDFYTNVVVSRFPVVHIPMNSMTLAVAACYKLNDNESFAKATTFIDQAHQEEDVYYLGRSGCIYALMAAQQKNPELGFEALEFVRRCVAKTNLQVYLLTQMDRLDDALRVMTESVADSTDDPTTRSSRLKFSKEVVEFIAAKAEQSEEDRLKKKVSIVFSKMDGIAQIIPDSLEAMTMTEIPHTYESRKVDSRTRQFRKPIDPKGFSKDLRQSFR